MLMMLSNCNDGCNSVRGVALTSSDVNGVMGCKYTNTESVINKMNKNKNIKRTKISLL